MTGYAQKDPVPNTKGCWYFIVIDECPVCGVDRIERTRMPAPAPENDQDRYEYNQVYDYCDAL